MNHTYDDAALLARMEQQITTWQSTGDRRVTFLACYTLMTRRMLAGLAAKRFHDGPWVHRLIHDFAAYYFVALETYDGRSQGLLPEVWQRTHRLTCEPGTSVTQGLLMGVNAHINCDLALVLDDLLAPEWATSDAAIRASRYADYCLVNTIIAETIDCVQDDVVGPQARLMQLVDRALGPLDEWCTARLITNWRTEVWHHTLAMLEAPDLATHQAMRQQADTDAVKRMDLLGMGDGIGARVFGYPLRYLTRLRLI
ncbi:MAG: DUF5995 family protein [Oscillochloridaceae bacterium umkhey_bin13]